MRGMRSGRLLALLRRFRRGSPSASGERATGYGRLDWQKTHEQLGPVCSAGSASEPPIKCTNDEMIFAGRRDDIWWPPSCVFLERLTHECWISCYCQPFVAAGELNVSRETLSATAVGHVSARVDRGRRAIA